ncbi:MAG: DNA polymerase III subunit gamma/tau, partial [Brevinematia bacterium]
SLKNSILKGKVPHALLFSGIRGVGKTTTARILAKALNCLNPGSDGEPCGECSQCIEITGGYSMNVIEIDGASNRGIDNIRDLRDTTIYKPMGGKYKVYIIDEVHMLTNEASNALLKTLEEPPPHVIFILATTEANKVLPTIKSRCQHYVFKKISNSIIVKQLKKIATSENIKFTEDGLYLIAEFADGSMRDAQSVFDQILLYTDGEINEESIKDILGIPNDSYFEELIVAALKGDYIMALNVIRNYYENYGELKIFLKNFINYLKNGLIAKKMSFDSALMDFSENKYNKLREIFKPFSENEIIKIIDLFTDLFKEMRSEVGEIFLFEIALFKFIDYKNLIKISEIKDEIFTILSKRAVSTPEKEDIFKPKIEKAVVTSKKEEEKTIPVNENSETQKKSQLEGNSIKKSFYDFMSRNVLIKPMLQYINSFTFKNNNIYIEFNKPHPLEYFTRNKAILERKFSDFIGFEVSLNFSISSDKIDIAPVESYRREPAIERKEEKKDTVVETIKELFNGKIE